MSDSTSHWATRGAALRSVTYETEHEAFVLEPDGRESYHQTLLPGRRHRAANWVSYSNIVQAAKVLQGVVVVRAVTTENTP